MQKIEAKITKFALNKMFSLVTTRINLKMQDLEEKENKDLVSNNLMRGQEEIPDIRTKTTAGSMTTPTFPSHSDIVEATADIIKIVRTDLKNLSMEEETAVSKGTTTKNHESNELKRTTMTRVSS